MDTIYIELDPELEALLSENEISISDILKSSGVSIEEQGFHREDNYSGAKDAVSIILASAGVILASTPLILGTIENILRRPVRVKRKRQVPHVDSSGQIILDENGQKCFVWEEIEELVEPTYSPSNTSVKLKGPLKLELSLDMSKNNL